MPQSRLKSPRLMCTQPNAPSLPSDYQFEISGNTLGYAGYASSPQVEAAPVRS